MNQTIPEVQKVLSAIADGAEARIKHLDQNRWMILVENIDYQPDNGSDPWLGFEITAGLA